MDAKKITRKVNLNDGSYDDVIIFTSPEYSKALIGISDDGRAVYDFDKMVDCLIEEDEMDEMEAIDFIMYNPMCCRGDNMPIIFYPLSSDEIEDI